MRPDDHELDEEIRGHLAISTKQRIDRGEDPASARLAALREFGNGRSSRAHRCCRRGITHPGGEGVAG